MSTTVTTSRFTQALETDLKAASINREQAETSVAARIKLVKWLNAWITKSNEGTIAQKLDAAKTLFEAQTSEAEDSLNNQITEGLEALERNFSNLFAGMTDSSRSVLAVIPHSNLSHINSALLDVVGKADSGDAKQMNLLMHSLIERATEYASEFKDKKEATVKFKEKLIELIRNTTDSFTPAFLDNFRASIEERKVERSIDYSLSSDEKLDSRQHLDKALELLILEKEGKPIIDLGERNINKDYEEWSKLSSEDRKIAQQEAIKFFANIENWCFLESLGIKDKQDAIQTQFNSIKNDNAKRLVRIKIQEEKTRTSLIKHQSDFSKLFANLFGEGFGSQALATIVLGFAGGSIFGMPGLGILFTAMISFLGRLEAPAKIRPPQPEQK